MEYINKVIYIWLMVATTLSALTTTIIMVEYSIFVIRDLKRKLIK